MKDPVEKPSTAAPSQVWSGDTGCVCRLDRSDPHTSLLTVAGDIDILTAAGLEQHIDEACSGDIEELVMDLSGVTFLSSRGIAALLLAHHRCEERGIRLLLAKMPRPVLRPLETTGLLPHFTVI